MAVGRFAAYRFLLIYLTVLCVLSSSFCTCTHNLHLVSLLQLPACTTTICLTPTCVCQQLHHQTQSDQHWGNPQSYKGLLKSFSLSPSIITQMTLPTRLSDFSISLKVAKEIEKRHALEEASKNLKTFFLSPLC